MHTLRVTGKVIQIHQCMLLCLSCLALNFDSIAIAALKKFLEHTESEVMLKYMDQQNGWPLLEKEDTCPHGCLHLAR